MTIRNDMTKVPYTKLEAELKIFFFFAKCKAKIKG